MKKRIISLILAISFLFPLVPPVRAEEKAAQTDLEAMIAEQFDAFAKSLKPEGASEGAAQLVKHSIKGGGNLTMDEDDKFTKAIMNASLLRTFFVHTATKVHEAAISVFGGNTVYMRGTCSWYQHNSLYTTRAFVDNENGNKDDDEEFSPRFTASISYYDGNLETVFNTYDQAMMLVSGDTRVWFTFRPQMVTDSTIRYRVEIEAFDSFDFTNQDGYSGDDRELEEFLTWTGGLLSLGLLTTFDWTATASFELELPNPCDHKSHNYRWEFDGKQDLHPVSGADFSDNPLLKKSGSAENGVFIDTHYTLSNPVHLNHDKPWDLEFRCVGAGSIGFDDDGTLSNGLYLIKTKMSVFFGEYLYLDETDAERTYCHYGVRYTNGTNISPNDVHTYRLTNRILEDGSNMVYLFIDGAELGPMNQYYHLSTSQNSTNDRISGENMVLLRLGVGSWPLDNITIDYIQVWENGKENAPFSYLSTSPAAPTCTADGGTLNTCSLCGAEFLTDVIPATGHDFTDWQTVKEATCTAEGKLERSCKTCGYKESRPVAVLPHAYAPAVTAPNCTDGGFTTYTCECGDSYVSDHTDALGHDLTDWTVTNDPTCTEDSLEERWCQRCEYREARMVDPLGHSYTATIVEPQCTVGGYTEYVCFCGDSYRTNFTNPTGHHYEGVVTEPGCTEMGYTTYTCACGDSYKSNFTAPVGHRYEGVVTAPTCTEGGFTTYVCSCGDSYVSNYTNALDHEFADGICNRCGDIDPNYQKLVENPFTDVPEDSFYFSPVLWAVENGITTGASETTFNPNGECMRAHVVTFLWRAAGSPEPSSNANPFVDVRETDFYYKAVLWAVEKGITNGSDATHFNPFGICNRAQVVTFLYRAFGSPAVENENNPFTDVPTVGWYTAPVLWAVQNGITNGLSADSFGPNSPCNRAQVVTFLHRAYN